MHFFLAEAFHDISPPVEYSLVPTWLVFILVALVLAGLGAIVWLIRRRLARPKPERSPRDRALELLEKMRGEISGLAPYQFSIRVSDILRSYVSEQYRLPLTRQTSVEFLESLAKTTTFTGAEQDLLGDFLNRCDLIKFARYEASSADSESLLKEATRFVKGGQLVSA